MMVVQAPCPNTTCVDGGFPWWDTFDREHECPECHGTGMSAHACDGVCAALYDRNYHLPRKETS